MNYNAFFLVALSWLSGLLAEVTVLKQVQVVYDTSPNIRIRGSGFDVVDYKIKLGLGVRGLPPLVTGKDFLVTLDENGDGLMLKLLSTKKWVDLTGLVAPVSLILSSVTFDGSEINLLHEPVTIASVLSVPTVKENPEYLIHSSASDELRIDGIGFIGAIKVDIYFDPPLVKEVAYEDMSAYPLTENQVILRLRRGYTWRELLGPLKVIGVDTGAGAVRVNGDHGVVVAQVVTDINVALSTANTQLTNNNKPQNAPAPGASVPAGVRGAGSDFLNDLVEKKKTVNQAQEQLRAVMESYELKLLDKELALKAREEQLQAKEQQLLEKEAAFRVQKLQLQERIQTLELQLKQQPQIPAREQEQQLQERLRALAKQLQD
eukprot:gene15601-17832_t